MNRTIKFRLRVQNKVVGYEKWYEGKWSEERGHWLAKPCWLYSTDGDYWNPAPIYSELKDAWTGLLDKNGKEIYEGDIVVKDGYIWFLENGLPNYRGTVEWYYSSWNVSVTCVNKDSHGTATGCGFNDSGLDEGSKSDWEIIGNLYENPELLTH